MHTLIRVVTSALVIMIAIQPANPFLISTLTDAPAAGITERISIGSNGIQGNSWSYSPSVSADGRYVAFYSAASNLVTGDTNSRSDVFVRDLVNGTTERASVSNNGIQGNHDSFSPSISADGRYVAFLSYSSNLVSGDTVGWIDVFVRDRVSGTTEKASLASDGATGNGDCTSLAISADGRYVAFACSASNLVSGDINGGCDVFIRDRTSGTTEIISIASDGTLANSGGVTPAISADGRYVAYISNSNNLVSGDTNESFDVFVRDRLSGTTERVSLSSQGTQANDHSYYADNPNLSISDNGRYVAFVSLASNLVNGDTNERYDIFVRDRVNGTTERISTANNSEEANNDSYYPILSADGRWIAFVSYASNLEDGIKPVIGDIFVRDRIDGTTERFSISSDGIYGNYSSLYPFISANGRVVAFTSHANNLVSGDTNNISDIFVHGIDTTIYYHLPLILP